MSASFERLRRMRFGSSARRSVRTTHAPAPPHALPDDKMVAISKAADLIGGPAVGRTPESRTSNGVHVWIPGSLGPLAPRNDAVPGAQRNVTCAGWRIPDVCRYRPWRRGTAG